MGCGLGNGPRNHLLDGGGAFGRPGSSMGRDKLKGDALWCYHNCSHSFSIWLILRLHLMKPAVRRVHPSSLTFRIRRYAVIAVKLVHLLQIRPMMHSLGAPRAIPPKLHPGPCSSVGIRRGTDIHTDRHTDCRHHTTFRLAMPDAICKYDCVQ